MIHSTAQTFIQYLENILQTSVIFDEYQTVYLTYKNTTSIGLRYGSNPYLLEIFACFGALPPINHEGFYKKLLKYHLFGIETLDAIFAISQEKNELYFTRVIECNHMTDSECVEALWQFCETFLIWKKRLPTLL